MQCAARAREYAHEGIKRTRTKLPRVRSNLWFSSKVMPMVVAMPPFVTVVCDLKAYAIWIRKKYCHVVWSVLWVQPWFCHRNTRTGQAHRDLFEFALAFSS